MYYINQKSMRNIIQDKKRLSAIISEMMRRRKQLLLFFYQKIGWGQILIKKSNTLKNRGFVK